VRHLGQGALSLASSTTMAKVFGSARGKALGIANLGYPLSEAVFPLLVSSVILYWNWRIGWLLLAVLITVFFSPAVFILLNKNPQQSISEPGQKPNIIENKISEALYTIDAPQHLSVIQMIQDKRFHMLLLPVVIPPLFLTGLFIHQAALTAMKGWDIQIVAAAFTSYAFCRAPVSFLIGPFIDKYSAKKLYPISLIPMGLGLLCFMIGNHVAWVFIYLAFIGISMGLGMTISGALWAELYGTKHLGRIRGVTFSIMVISTAIAPIIMGALLDAAIGLNTILMGMMAINALGFILAYLACYHQETTG